MAFTMSYGKPRPVSGETPHPEKAAPTRRARGRAAAPVLPASVEAKPKGGEIGAEVTDEAVAAGAVIL